MWARIRSLVRGVASRSRVERDMDEELRFHLEARADDLVTRRNLAPQDARRLARVEFGSVEKYKEETREARGLRLIDAVRGDLRYSVRQLRAYPVFTAAAVLTLALGIGPNAAMATIISGIFRPLPVADAHQMTVLATTLSANRRVRQRLAYPDLQDYKSSSAAFSDMAAWDLNPVGLTADGRTDRLMATVVSGDYFSTLRLEPAAGRLILPSDGEFGGAEPIVVLGHSYWTRRFGASPSIVGRDVRIDGRPFTVVGVAPEGFHGTFTLMSSDAYLPLELFQSRARLSDRDVLSVRVIARLKPGMALGEARASVETVAARLEQDHPATNAGRRVRVHAERLARPEPQNESQGVVLAALFLMLVGAVLLIACANVLGLFLARGLGRGREMAIRAALGASRWDLVRLCLIEALAIALLGAVAGAGAGLAAVRGLAAAASIPGFPLFLDFRLDWETLTYLTILMIVSTLLIGLLPAIRASRVNPRSDLSGSMTATHGRRRQLIRKGLAAAQMAASVVLLVVCGLFMRSLQGLQSADLGFDAGSCAAGLDGSRRGGLRRRQSACVLRIPRRGIGSAARGGIRGRFRLRPIRYEQFHGIRGRRRPAGAIEYYRSPGRQALRQRRLLSGDGHAGAARPQLYHGRHTGLAEGGGRQRNAGGASVARRGSSRTPAPRECRSRLVARSRRHRARRSIPPRRDRTVPWSRGISCRWISSITWPGRSMCAPDRDRPTRWRRRCRPRYAGSIRPCPSTMSTRWSGTSATAVRVSAVRRAPRW